ncbi:MAG: YCF48-related protein, partial [Deltaproteobacteria bacterium]
YALGALLALAVTVSGCHGSGEWSPLTSQKIYVSDKFYDVALLGPKHAIVVGYGGKILKTKDAGITWANVDSGTDNSLYSIDFAADGKTGWIVGQEGSILKTIDGGETWVQQAQAVEKRLRSLLGARDKGLRALDDARDKEVEERLVSVVNETIDQLVQLLEGALVVNDLIDEYGDVLLDKGSEVSGEILSGLPRGEWVNISVGKVLSDESDEQTGEALLLQEKKRAIVGEFREREVAIHDEVDSGYVTKRDGVSAEYIANRKEVFVENPNTIFLVPECRDPKLGAQRLDDERCDAAYLFAVDAIDENNVVVVGDRSVFASSRDGGKTWTDETLTFVDPDMSPDWLLAFEDPILYDIEFIDARNGYIVGEFGKIYHTTDGGRTWGEQHKSLMDASVFDVLDMPTLFDVEFSDLEHGIAVGLDGRIALTNDGGQDWNFVDNNVADYEDPFYSAAILPDGTRWAVGASGQSVSAGPGNAFGRASLGGAVNSWLRRIRFYDKDTAWIVGGFGLIMNTHDGGKTWYRRIG